MNLLFIILFALTFIITVIIGLGGALFPLILAFGLAYLLFPLIKAIEKRGFKREYAILSVFLLNCILVCLFAVILFPRIFEELKFFITELPQTSAKTVEKIEMLFQKFGVTLDISKQGLKEYLDEHSNAIPENITKFLKGIFSNFANIVLISLNFILLPLFFFHIIINFEHISKELKSLIPLNWLEKFNEYVRLSDTILSGYIRGQILVATILAALYSIGFSIVGLRFGLLIGILTGLLSIIPYVGPVFGFVCAIIITMTNFTGFGPVVSLIVVFAVIQALESFIITPKLVGDKVGLGALSTILALIIGGNLFGFIGMIVAIPLAAIMQKILKDLKAEYVKLNFYRGNKL